MNASNSTAPASWSPTLTRDAASADAWRQVHVGQVTLQRAAVANALSVVRASITLGRLLPCDARVELTLEDAGSQPGGDVTERMWTSRAYDNGCYLFEAHVPDAEVEAARRATIRVRPSGDAACSDAPVAPAGFELSAEVPLA